MPSLLGAEQCWWDGHQLHFRVLLPDGLLITSVRAIGRWLVLSQRTALTAPGVARYGGGQNLLPLRPGEDTVHGDHPWARLYY